MLCFFNLCCKVPGSYFCVIKPKYMLKDFIRGFIFMFVLLMVYLIAVNFILMYSAEGLGLYKNIPLFIGLAIFLNVAPFIVITIIDRIKKRSSGLKQMSS